MGSDTKMVERGWANPGLVDMGVLNFQNGIFYPLSALLNRRLSKGEERPVYVDPKFFGEFVGHNTRLTKVDPKSKYVYVSDVESSKPLSRFMGSRLTLKGFMSESALIDFCSSHLHFAGISELIKRRDISLEIKKSVLLKRIQNEMKNGASFWDSADDLVGVEKVFTPSELMVELLGSLKDHKYLQMSLKNIYGRRMEDQEVVDGMCLYLETLPNTTNFEKLTEAVEKVRTATSVHQANLEEAIGDRIVLFVRDIGSSHSNSSSGATPRELDDLVKTLPKPIRQRVREEIATIGKNYFANTPGKEGKRIAEHFALTYSIHRAKGRVEFQGDKAQENLDKFVDGTWGPALGFVFADKKNPLEVVDHLMAKYKRRIGELDAVRERGGFSYEGVALEFAESSLYRNFEMLSNDYDWSQGKLSEDARKDIWQEFIRRYVAFHDARYTGEGDLTQKGVARAIEKFGSSFHYHPEFHEATIRMLVVQGDGYDAIALAKLEALPSDIADQTVKNVSDVLLGRKATKALKRASAHSNGENGRAVDDLLELFRRDSKIQPASVSRRTNGLC